MPGSARIDRTARARVRRSSRDVGTTQGTLRPPAFARNQRLGGRFLLRGLLTRPASVTAGVVAIKVWNSHFFPSNARTVPVRLWSCTNTVESTVKSWEPVGYFALSPCGRGMVQCRYPRRLHKLGGWGRAGNSQRAPSAEASDLGAPPSGRRPQPR